VAVALRDAAATQPPVAAFLRLTSDSAASPIDPDLAGLQDDADEAAWARTPS
jgi:hypothetical protein